MRGDPSGRRKVDLLIRYLSFQDASDVFGAPVRLPSQHEWCDLVAAALSTQLYPALIYCLGRRDPTAFETRHLDRRRSPPMRNFHYRSGSQRRHLLQAVRALNAAGIEPWLACGARELWLEAPDWRFVQEIELLVPPGALDIANVALEGCGWQRVRALVASGYRTETWWIHRDTTGHLGVRGAGTHRAVERVLPWSRYTRGGLIGTVDGALSRLTTPAGHCLYAVVSQHCAPASRGGTIAAIKPLYELAARLVEMQSHDRSELRDTVAGNPELSTIFGVWLAAACRTFGLPPVVPLDNPVDARGAVELVDIAGQFHVALRCGSNFLRPVFRA